ncbi:hypothetical protein L208DRAFT_1406680 [Tricholoma matsutake]|nr:hypothetical protein L208DRAFT_1406677 [Tricholoma matsutake 945]KAF8226661.1 hypothetical protein L208DRAFT_1406680 [Tricholoma matsutake 945]
MCAGYISKLPAGGAATPLQSIVFEVQSRRNQAFCSLSHRSHPRNIGSREFGHCNVAPEGTVIII